MKRFYVVASIPLLLAALIPIAASLWVAHRQAKEDQVAYLTSLADEVLRRGVASRQQLVAALNDLDGDPHPACSQASLTRIQQLVGTSFYLQGMGAVRDGALVCSTLTAGNEVVQLTGNHMVTSTGISTWIGARLPFAPEQPFNIYARNGHAVIIHPGIVIDMPVLHADVALGLLISTPRALIRSKGPLDTQWLNLYTPHVNNVAESETHYIVFRVSKENNVAAVAAAPKALAHEGLKAQALILAPLGLVASALFALGVAMLTRWQLSPRARLRAALRRREFFVLYQPIVDLETGQWVGAEALLRWRRRNGTLVPPDEFIAEAEKAGVIVHITRYVMDVVLADLPEMLKARPGFHVSLNLSPQDLVADGPVQYLQRRFSAMEMPPGALMLEVTERGLVDIEAARPALQAARQIGASIALDDFGTGYSSLSMLESIDIDTLKIDRIFIASIGAQAAISPVTTHIIEMAHMLKLALIAEGVETQDQVDFLIARGVRQAQGWKFAHAMPLNDLLAGMRPQPAVSPRGSAQD
ncbi:EAL domain-containing protein [Acidovorax delafieldii]|nr:EAL domain-containing protein [Acidovorax delafieldii]